MKLLQLHEEVGEVGEDVGDDGAGTAKLEASSPPRRSMKLFSGNQSVAERRTVCLRTTKVLLVGDGEGEEETDLGLGGEDTRGRTWSSGSR